MSRISLKWFGGMVPRRGEQHLPRSLHATEAENCNLYSGELRPLKKPSLSHQFCRPDEECWRSPLPDDPSVPPPEPPPEPPLCVPVTITGQTPDPANIPGYSEGDPAIFTVSVNADATAPVQYQWYKNGVAIPGAVDSAYAFTITIDDSYSEYTVSVQNPCGLAVSIVWYIEEISLGYRCDAVESAIRVLSPTQYWYFPQYNTDITRYPSDVSPEKAADPDWDLVVGSGSTSFHSFGDLPADFVTCTFQRELQSSNTGSSESFWWAPSTYDVNLHRSLAQSGTVVVVMGHHEAASNYTWMGFRCTGGVGPTLHNCMQYYRPGGNHSAPYFGAIQGTRVRTQNSWGGTLWYQHLEKASQNDPTRPDGYDAGAGGTLNMWVQAITWNNTWSAPLTGDQSADMLRTQMRVYFNDRGLVDEVDKSADEGWWVSANPPVYREIATSNGNSRFSWSSNGDIVTVAIWDRELSGAEIANIFKGMRRNYITIPSYYQ